MVIGSLVTSWKRSVLGRREEANPFILLRREIDSQFDNFFRGVNMEPFENREGIFRPKVDVTENDTEIKVRAELPEIVEKDIEVSLNKDSLTIRGEKKAEMEQEERPITTWNGPMVF